MWNGMTPNNRTPMRVIGYICIQLYLSLFQHRNLNPLPPTPCRFVGWRYHLVQGLNYCSCTWHNIYLCVTHRKNHIVFKYKHYSSTYLQLVYRNMFVAFEGPAFEISLSNLCIIICWLMMNTTLLMYKFSWIEPSGGPHYVVCGHIRLDDATLQIYASYV